VGAVWIQTASQRASQARGLCGRRQDGVWFGKRAVGNAPPTQGADPCAAHGARVDSSRAPNADFVHTALPATFG